MVSVLISGNIFPLLALTNKAGKALLFIDNK